MRTALYKGNGGTIAMEATFISTTFPAQPHASDSHFNDASYERMMRLASDFFHTPVAAITLYPHGHQWLNIARGFAPIPFHAAYAFGMQAARTQDTIIVPDLSSDTRFQNHPLLRYASHLRFYAGMPLRDAQGKVLGGLWLADDAPRHTPATTLTQLRAFGAWARAQLREPNSELAPPPTPKYMNQHQMQTLQSLQSLYGVGLIVQDRTGHICACDPYAEYILGLSADQIRGRKGIDFYWQSIHSDGRPFPGDTHPATRALQTGIPQSDIMGVYKLNGRITWIAIRSLPLWRPDELYPYAVISSLIDITEQQTQMHVLEHDPGFTHAGDPSRPPAASIVEEIRADVQLAQQAEISFSVVQFTFPSLAKQGESACCTIQKLADLLKPKLPCTDLVVVMDDAQLMIVMPQTDEITAYRRAEQVRRFLAVPPTPYLPCHTWFAVTTMRGNVQ